MRYLSLLNKNTERFLERIPSIIGYAQGLVILDVGGGKTSRLNKYLTYCRIISIDIDPEAEPDYLLNAEDMSFIDDNTIDHVACIEVLEHVLYPQRVVDEIYRVLKPGGYVFVTVPFNLSIHGPIEYWRFTDQALRHIFQSFELIELSSRRTPGRTNMPIQYTLIGRKTV